MKMENRMWLILLILAALAGCTSALEPGQKPRLGLFQAELPVPWARAPLPPI